MIIKRSKMNVTLILTSTVLCARFFKKYPFPDMYEVNTSFENNEQTNYGTINQTDPKKQSLYDHAYEENEFKSNNSGSNSSNSVDINIPTYEKLEIEPGNVINYYWNKVKNVLLIHYKAIKELSVIDYFIPHSYKTKSSFIPSELDVEASVSDDFAVSLK